MERLFLCLVDYVTHRKLLVVITQATMPRRVQFVFDRNEIVRTKSKHFFITDRYNSPVLFSIYPKTKFDVDFDENANDQFDAENTPNKLHVKNENAPRTPKPR